MVTSSGAAATRAAPVPLKRKIAAILAADVAGYSRLVAEDEERTLHDLAAAREIFDALVAQAGGRIFNTAGDSVMCEFDSAVEAVRAAVDIQEHLRSRNLGTDPKRRLEFRMGLTIGDVVERGGDLLGDGVNIAARLEGMAPPGGICVSRSVHEAVANKLSVTFRELGARRVKNMPQAVHAYLIAPPAPEIRAIEPLLAPDETRATEPRGGQRRAAGRPQIWGRLVLGLVILAGLAIGWPAMRMIRPMLGIADTPATVAARPEMANPPRLEAPSPVVPSAPEVTRPAKPAQGQDRPQAPVAKPRTPTRPVETAKPAEPARPVEQAKPVEITKPTETPKPVEPPRPVETARPADPPREDPPKSVRRDLPTDPAAAFAALAKEDILPDARTLPELYHNARLSETRGDRPAALAAYAAAAPLAGDYLDPLLRYASALRSQKGAAAVRQAFAALVRSNPADAAGLVAALGSEGEERRARLDAFLTAHPDAAAAEYFLGESLEGREGGPTLTERRLAFDSFDRFLDAATGGDLPAHFIDRTLMEGWVEDARKRRGQIEAFFAQAKTRPTATFARTATGWLARIALPEPALAMATRLGERGEFVPAGSSRAADPRTGKPTPNAEVELPSSTARATLYVTYTDRVGREAGPFPLPFDPGIATVESGRAALERFPETWVAFRPDIPDVLSYAGLVSNRCAITRALIGYGDAPPRQALPLPPCDPTGPAAMPSATSLVRLPDGTESVQVQLVYADGQESQVRTFRRP